MGRPFSPIVLPYNHGQRPSAAPGKLLEQGISTGTGGDEYDALAHAWEQGCRLISSVDLPEQDRRANYLYYYDGVKEQQHASVNWKDLQGSVMCTHQWGQSIR